MEENKPLNDNASTNDILVKAFERYKTIRGVTHRRRCPVDSVYISSVEDYKQILNDIFLKKSKLASSTRTWLQALYVEELMKTLTKPEHPEEGSSDTVAVDD